MYGRSTMIPETCARTCAVFEAAAWPTHSFWDGTVCPATVSTLTSAIGGGVGACLRQPATKSGSALMKTAHLAHRPVDLVAAGFTSPPRARHTLIPASITATASRGESGHPDVTRLRSETDVLSRSGPAPSRPVVCPAYGLSGRAQLSTRASWM